MGHDAQRVVRAMLIWEHWDTVVTDEETHVSQPCSSIQCVVRNRLTFLDRRSRCALLTSTAAESGHRSWKNLAESIVKLTTAWSSKSLPARAQNLPVWMTPHRGHGDKPSCFEPQRVLGAPDRAITMKIVPAYIDGHAMGDAVL